MSHRANLAARADPPARTDLPVRADLAARADRAIRAVLLVLAVASCLYLVFVHADLVRRSGSPTGANPVLGAVAVGVVLEMTRRTVGWGPVTVAVGALLYAVSGPWLPPVCWPTAGTSRCLRRGERL